MALPSPPISPIHLVTANTLQCSACKKIFKSKRGLSQHEAIVRRYNSFHVGLYKLTTKFYHGNEMTLAVTNLDENVEENPLDRKRKLLAQKKTRYKRGEVIIEWKPQKVKDIKGNICEGGFLCIHFWIIKRRITV